MTLIEMIRSAGVVGAGGAGFPTHVKAASSVDTVLVNGAECEPLLVTDQWVAVLSAEAIVRALRMVGDQVGAKRLMIGVKQHYHQLIEAFSSHLDGNPVIQMVLVDDYYPAGDEQVLVLEATGRIVPEGGIPLDVGVVVMNVSTLRNVAEAIEGRPVISKEVTVAGEVANPGVYRAPIGTSIAEVIAGAGGATIPSARVVEGGPMMGRLVRDLDDVIVKTTSGLLVLPPDSTVVQSRETPIETDYKRALAVCCQCRMCTDMCSRNLIGHRIEPHRVMRAVLAGMDLAPHVLAQSFLCSQCGICEAWSCPMGLSPRKVYGDLRARLIAQGVRNPLRNRPDAPRESQSWARVPKGRLTERLGLKPYVLPHVGSVIPIPRPVQVRIPLKQHVGVPAKPIVAVGDRVFAGQCIAEIPEGALGARVHASIDGVVTAIHADSIRIGRSL